MMPFAVPRFVDGVARPGLLSDYVRSAGKIRWYLNTHQHERATQYRKHLHVGHADLNLWSISCSHCQRALTEAEIRNILRRFARSKRLSSLGANRFAKMTAEERSAEGRRAAVARWAKREARDS
jgi:hypothetical protein